jgi:hypothetical protein
MSRKASKQKEINCLGTFCRRSRDIPLFPPQLNEICGVLQEEVTLHFFARTYRNTPFLSLPFIISSKFAVRLFTAREIRILKNGSLGWGKKGALNSTPKPTEIILWRAVVSSLSLISFLRKLRGDQAL